MKEHFSPQCTIPDDIIDRDHPLPAMVELKVWVDGVPRVVCGISEFTTCQEVVVALAQSTGQVGRFNLLEKSPKTERILHPQESPYRALEKWGPMSKNVRYYLRRKGTTPHSRTPHSSRPSSVASFNLSSPDERLMNFVDFSVDGEDEDTRAAAYQSSTFGDEKQGVFQRLELARHTQMMKEEEERRRQEAERKMDMERHQTVEKIKEIERERFMDQKREMERQHALAMEKEQQRKRERWKEEAKARGVELSSQCLSDRIVLSNRVSLAGSAAVIATGFALGGDHGLPNHPTRMLRITLFGGLYGTQIWNTFVSGTTLVLSVPRHTFGEVQTYLFPAYFNFSIVLSAATIGVHLYFYPTSVWTRCERIFTIAGGTGLVCNLVQSAFLLERNVSIMQKMFAIEKAEGLGQEQGRPKSEKLDNNEEYQKLKKQFRVAHGVSSLFNMVALGSSLVQLMYFAQHGF